MIRNGCCASNTQSFKFRMFRQADERTVLYRLFPLSWSQDSFESLAASRTPVHTPCGTSEPITADRELRTTFYCRFPIRA